MKRENLLTIAVFALLLLNFGTLGFLFFSRPPHGPGPGRFDKHMVEQLQLDAAQRQQFETLKTAHHEQMIASDRAYRDALENYFALLKSDTPAPAQADSLLHVLAKIQRDRALATFQHFQALRQQCTAEQRQRFDAMLPELIQVIQPARKPAPHR